MNARLTPDRRFVEISGPRWSDRWPVESLAAWLRFYRRMRDRADGRHARHYRMTVVELERIAAELRGSPGPSVSDAAARQPAPQRRK